MGGDHPVARNVRQKMSGYAMLKLIDDGSAALVMFDPQYRAVLDHLEYGNEGARQKARANLPQMSDRMIRLFVEEIERVLRPSGHLAMWFDKFAIGEGLHVRYFDRAPLLKTVDLLCWNTLRFGMGARLRRATEYLLISQKKPHRAVGVWTDHAIRDCWPETSDRSLHAHAKPYQLIERLIRATTKRGDLVVDPCAGSYLVLDACKAAGREFAGCDIL